MPERGFLIFWIFLLFFFRNFLPQAEYQRKSGQNFFFSLFRSIYSSFRLKVIPERDFLNFWFFFNFFRNFLARAEYERNSGQEIFSSFFSLSHPVLAKNNARKRFFFFFLIFFLFFLEFSCSGWVRTEFRTKFFFSLSRLISSRFGKK